MGEDYVARARAIWDALIRGQMHTVDHWLADDIQWRPASGETLEGRDEFAAFVDANLPSHDAVAHDFEPIGDCVLVHGSLRRFRDGGFLDVQPTWVLHFRDGVLIAGHAAGTRAEAIAAVDRFGARRAT